MVGRIRLFLWRHQRTLTILYGAGLAIGWVGLLVFAFQTPSRFDTGIG